MNSIAIQMSPAARRAAVRLLLEVVREPSSPYETLAAAESQRALVAALDELARSAPQTHVWTINYAARYTQLRRAARRGGEPVPDVPEAVAVKLETVCG